MSTSACYYADARVGFLASRQTEYMVSGRQTICETFRQGQHSNTLEKFTQCACAGGQTPRIVVVFERQLVAQAGLGVLHPPLN
jgi:hypothetical protein